jgi:hypothetical protein
MTLTREQILASRKDRKPVRLEVPEWGGDVFVRVLSAADQMVLSDGVEPKEMALKVIVHCLVTEDGERIFGDDDAGELAKEDFPVIMRVFGFVAKQNGLSTKELEEAMENFGPSPNGSKSSESLLPLG